MTTNQALINYKNACEDIREVFVERYFNTFPEFTDESYWIADRAGEVLYIQDYFFDMATIMDALELRVKEVDLFKWYDESVEAQSRGANINLRSWIKMERNIN